MFYRVFVVRAHGTLGKGAQLALLVHVRQGQ